MWDYIIVGAGSAGCVLANRLSANPLTKVLLLEAGGTDQALRFKVPALGGLRAMYRPDSDWRFTTEADPSCNDRTDLWPRGKVLGGSSAINGTIYVRGNRGDYDQWAQMGNTGWDYDSLVPYFQRIENGSKGSSPVYGKTGPIHVESTRGAPPLVDRYLEAMAELGVPTNPDYNGETQTGASKTHVTQHRGWRWSAARGYLAPIRSRSNLSIMTHCFVRRVVIENQRAVGVEIEQGGIRRVERCNNEVLISASAFNSPKILMLSGIGDPQELQEHNIPVIHANKNVGRNLQEHPVVPIMAYVNVPTNDMSAAGMLRHGLRFGLFGTGPATYLFPAISFVKLNPESLYADIQIHFALFGLEKTSDGVRMLDQPAVTIQANVNRSQSRGYVKLRSGNPEDPPIIQPNLLGSRYDLDTLVSSVKFIRKILKTKAFSPYVKSEYIPGPGIESDKDLEEYVRSKAAPCFHASGTVKMGADDTAVVTPRLKVIGVEGLRVIDSSVIPQVPSGNINAISMVIGEKGSDFVLQDARN